MRRLALFVLMTLMAATLALAADTTAAGASTGAAPAVSAPADTAPSGAAPAPAATCNPVDLNKMPEAERNAWLAERGLQIDRSQQTVGPPPCPSIFGCGSSPTCTAGAGCAQTSLISNTDTHNPGCSTGGGGGLTCTNGQTIHVYEYNCHSCPCCTMPPGQACMCGACSGGQGFGCADSEIE